MEEIRQALKNRMLPDNKLEILRPLLQADETFVGAGQYWDFKREWPFSYSDNYFAGIARLICAFSNTHGGLIIFGVHDENRSGGHNKVAPNLDRMEKALEQLLTAKPFLLLRKYDGGTPQAVDVLLVLPNSPSMQPVQFRKSLGQYSADIIWVRQSHEVIEAEPRHIGLLYCRTHDPEEGSDDVSVEGGLPPSPATIKRFVGRVATIDNVFHWLKLSDEPRTFLYGKGGSGKTTIAYE